ncbi:MAG: hypothetical protein RR743_07500 [Oscillospiraceae bacterium]
MNDLPMNFYVDYINRNVLPKINYNRLQADYETADKAYAKSVLNALHQGALAVYGTETFDEDAAGGYVLLPGVVQSKSTGNLCIALLELDLQSSGEHCGTDFLTHYGCIHQFEEEMPATVRTFLHDTYGSYDYAYTMNLENDIHIDPRRFSPEIRELLDTFKDYEFEPVERKLEAENINADDEEWER